jgi:type II secretory pathway component GspD/PulD (secretin)
MMLKQKAVAVLMGFALVGIVTGVGAQEKRTLKVIEDRGQKNMATKIYELKHTKGVDLTPFVIGAVTRYSKESSVERLVCKPTNQQFITVNTGAEMLPYVDDLIAKLDRPGKVDEAGSVVDGTGITNSVYYPRFRMAAEFKDIAKTTGSADGIHFVDHVNNMVYFKDSKSDGENVIKNLQFFDRPVPQVEMTVNVYEISDDNLKELGIDYISWKNGPGANIFAGGLDILDFNKYVDSGSWTNSLNTTANLSNNFGGFMVAPQIDATFLRMLNQKGKAKIATSGVLSFDNDFMNDPGAKAFSKAKYKVKFTPNYQDIVKDKDQNVSVTSAGAEFYFYLRKPTVNFNGFKMDDKVVAAEFGWELQVSDTVEKTNTGADVRDVNYFTGWTTMDVGGERLLASYAKQQISEQNNGIPVLCEIPVLKYIFGSTVESKSNKRVFVTVATKPLDPKMDLSQWAGEIVNISRTAMDEEKN